MYARLIVVSALFGGLAGIAYADTRSEDECEDVLRFGARNYSLEMSFISKSLRLYEKICSGSTAKDISNLNLSADTFYQAVPIKFKLENGSDSEKATHFCRTFDEDYRTHEDEYKKISSVNNESVSAWLQCKILFTKGIIFLPSQDLDIVKIQVKRLISKDIQVNGVLYNPDEMSCSAPGVGTKKNNKRAIVNSKTEKKLTDDYWPVTCTRKPEKHRGEIVYPRTNISIDTTEGSFSYPLAAEAKYPYQWASEVQKQLDDFSSQIKTLTDYLGKPEVMALKGATSPDQVVRASFCAIAAVNDTIAPRATASECRLTYAEDKQTWTLKTSSQDNQMYKDCALVCFGVKR